MVPLLQIAPLTMKILLADDHAVVRKGIRDFLELQAHAASYQPFVITQSSGAIYDLLLVKGQMAFAVNLTLGSDMTIITANRVGVMHLKVSGVANAEIDLRSLPLTI